MPVQDLKTQRCTPCEGGTPPLSTAEARSLVAETPGWSLSGDTKAVSRSYKMKDFMAAVDFIRTIAEVAEREDHHPDVHLTGYRNLKIELSTHSIGGLSKNDFIMASKIDELPKELKA